MADYNPNINDAVSISESITGLLPTLNVSVNDAIVVQDVYVKSVSDVALSPINNTIVSVQNLGLVGSITNGTTYSSSFRVRSTLLLRFFFSYTVVVTASIAVTIQTSPDNSTWYDALTVGTVTQPKFNKLTTAMEEPGTYIRVKTVKSGTATCTQSVMAKHMPVRRVYRRK